MNRIRAVSRCSWRHAISYVTINRDEFYVANIDTTDGLRVFERYQIGSASKPSILSDSWFQL